MEEDLKEKREEETETFTCTHCGRKYLLEGHFKSYAEQKYFEETGECQECQESSIF